MERLIVVGPESELAAGVVSSREYSIWRSYLQREGQPLLACPAGVESVLIARKLKRMRSPGRAMSPVYQLEFHDAEAEEALFPDQVTWRTYFRDVHEIEADSTDALLEALRDAGWKDEQIARYAHISLEDQVPRDSPERKAYDEHRIKLCESEEVFIGPLECAYALLEEATRDFRTSASPASVVGRIRFYPSRNLTRLRRVEALGALTLTALQELFNRHGAAIRVQLARPDDHA